MHPLVTIAISAYNVEEYISAALESIIAQSYTNLEILCIDDASSDATWDIMRDFAKRDKRIRLLRNDKNRGLAYNRNISLENARGEWILMADGDDLLHRLLIEKVITTVTDNDADMVMWDYKEFYDDSTVNLIDPPEMGCLSFPVKDKTYLINTMCFTWTRLIKTSTCRQLNINFPLGKTKQDIPAHWKEIVEIDKIAILNERLSFYRQRKGATSRRNDKSLFDWIYNLNLTEKYLKETTEGRIYLNEMYKCQLNAFIMSNRMIKPSLRSSLREKFAEKLTGDFKKYYDQELKTAAFFTRENLKSLNGSRFSMLIFGVLCTLCDLRNYLCKI